MKLGEFIEKFSHNNVIRLVYKEESGHSPVDATWNDVSMDHEVNRQKGRFRHFINNEVLGLATIGFGPGTHVHHREALNIVIERLDNQPYLQEIDTSQNNYSEAV